ncbi:hypothetical protein ACKLTP_17185 [Paenarthrobacter ureafaciens]|uniref:hypothetical protein n=2 Tax=Paenarthrobacter TaxID=1742992 RepID=UPI003978F197
MMLIPFSVLQAVYFGAGLAELGLLLLMLKVASPLPGPVTAGKKVTGQRAQGTLGPVG